MPFEPEISQFPVDSAVKNDIYRLFLNSQNLYAKIDELREKISKNNFKIAPATSKNLVELQIFGESIAEIQSKLQIFGSEIAKIKKSEKLSPWKNPVEKFSDLPNKNFAHEGEVRYIAEEKVLKVFDGENWTGIGSKNSNDNLQKNSFTFSQIAKIHSSRSAEPGIFYWDRTNKEYFVGLADGGVRPLFGDARLPGFSQDADWIDLRFFDLKKRRYERTAGLAIDQNSQFGLKISGNPRSEWNQAVAFSNISIDRAEKPIVEIVFYSGKLVGQVMIGLADENVDVNNLQNLGFKKPEIALYMQDGHRSNKLYGKKSDGSGWYDMLDLKKPWKKHKFYKIKFSLGKNGLRENFTIDEVDEKNFDKTVQNIADFATNNDSTAKNLKLFWIVNGISDYRWVAFRKR